MPTFEFNKLVRDRIVTLCLEDPLVVETNYHELTDLEFKRALKNKLFEEADEIPIQDNVDDEVVAELADIQTVIDALREAYGVSGEIIRKTQKMKAEKKGEFKKRLFIDTVVCDETSPWTKDFRSRPGKYPELDADQRSKILPMPPLKTGTYRHYKGGEYEVLTLAVNEATHEWCVVYRALYDTGKSPSVWVRTAADFMARLDDGRQRFTYLRS